jgi:hypothetical protein
MALQESETARQFQQNYLAKYNALKDAATLKLSQATAGYSAQAGANQSQYNQLIDAIKIGSGQVASAGAAGSSATGQASNVLSGLSSDLQNSILQSGAASSNVWSTVGQTSQNTANSLLSYFMNS